MEIYIEIYIEIYTFTEREIVRESLRSIIWSKCLWNVRVSDKRA